MSERDSKIAIVRQLSAQGWSEEAIAGFVHIHGERLRDLLRAIETQPDAPAGSHPDIGTDSGKAAAVDLGKVDQPETAAAHQAAEAPDGTTLEQQAKAHLKALAPLDKQRAEQQAKSQALRDEITRLMRADRDPRRGLAKRIHGRLDPAMPAISLRTVQWHIRKIRRGSCGGSSRETT